MLLHINAFRLDVDSQRRSLWHQLTPQTRVLGVLIFVVAIALTPNGHWLTWSIYGLGVLTLIRISNVTLWVLFKRLAVESLFVGVAVLGTLFRTEGTPLWQWGWLRITEEGLMILGSVGCKLLLSLSLLNLLTLTMAIPVLLNALSTLKMPPLLIAIMASMYRYLSVLVEEFNTMRRATQSRNLTKNPAWQRLVLGNLIGSLFIRSYTRGEKIHQAMLSRGYQGTPPTFASPKLKTMDWGFLGLVLSLTILGQWVYFFVHFS